jgi:lysophospholipase L1-like esterase
MAKKLIKSFVWMLAVSIVLCSCLPNTHSNFIRESDYVEPIRLACIGDSITFGFGIKNRGTNNYPAQLGAMLGNSWDVKNFGISRVTLLKKGNVPYWNQKEFKKALEFNPDVVVIKLGTNDTKPVNWKYKDEFVGDYIDLIEQFRELEAKPKIWICYPVPVFPERWGISDKVITEGIIPLIDEVAHKTDVPIIDLHSALRDKADMFPDLIHPNAEGAKLIAEAIFHALTGRKAITNDLNPASEAISH